VLNPQATVKEGYHITSIVRHDGSIIAGVLLRETPTELVLRDALDVGASRTCCAGAVALDLPGLPHAARPDEPAPRRRARSMCSRSCRGSGATVTSTVPNVPYIRRYEMMEAGNTVSAQGPRTLGDRRAGPAGRR
jgi:hypothetical protein